MRPLAIASLLLCLPACRCFVPVDEFCYGIECPRRDAGSDGAVDGGGVDGGGLDAGGLDGGAPDGGPGVCGIWEGNGVGKCAAITGYVFDGDRCAGECVLYPIEFPGIFATVGECARACALPYCDPSLFKALLPQPFTPAAYCDELAVQTLNPRAVLDAFPDAGLDGGCTTVMGQSDCRLLTSRTLGDAGYALACAATLLPGTQSVTCRLYGP